MKKLLIILGLILLCVGYFFTVQNRNDKIENDRKKSMQELLKEESDMLTKQYPENVKEVMESHDRLMSYQYSNEMKEELVPEVVKTIRLLYSSPLLALNPEDQQNLAMLGEVLNNKENKVTIIKSEIEQIEYTDKNKKAIVTAKHSTTRGDKLRRYQLVQEKGQWKINWWEDIRPTVVPVKTEEPK